MRRPCLVCCGIVAGVSVAPTPMRGAFSPGSLTRRPEAKQNKTHNLTFFLYRYSADIPISIFRGAYMFNEVRSRSQTSFAKTSSFYKLIMESIMFSVNLKVLPVSGLGWTWVNPRSLISKLTCQAILCSMVVFSFMSEATLFQDLFFFYTDSVQDFQKLLGVLIKLQIKVESNYSRKM